MILKKSYEQDGAAESGGNSSVPDAEALTKINRFTRREFSAKELYVFPVVLCDNEIDRDGERFSTQALEKLAELFVGKTGIFNHSGRAEDQSARIFDCRVEKDIGRTTSAGEPYACLKAGAYLPRTEWNAGLIEELESGIKKEVSVGCAVESITCSVCGADLKTESCRHERGRRYEGQVCCAVLDKPTDAYEWSFVAVPAQREAGVVKCYTGKGGTNMEELEKALHSGGPVTFSREEAEKLAEKIAGLEREAECGRAYREEMTKEFVRCAMISRPGIPQESLRRAADGMNLEDLKCFAGEFRKEAERVVPLSPQLAAAGKQERENENSMFKI